MTQLPAEEDRSRVSSTRISDPGPTPYLLEEDDGDLSPGLQLGVLDKTP